MVFIDSCETEDIDPESITSEITITNVRIHWNNYKQECEISSNIKFTGLTPVRNEFVGHCWNFNTDTLPTVESQVIKKRFDIYCDLSLFNCNNYIYTNIATPKHVNKVVVRCFFIFNDAIVRYSDPMVLIIPR
jgi:hypothetical protein